jgi:hypothetical protein
VIPDEMLREAIARTYESYISHLLSDYDPEYRCEFSPIFEKKIKKLMRRADHPILYHTLKRIAVILLTLLIAGTVWISVDADARAAFFGWVSDTISTYFVYNYIGEANDSFDSSDYRPNWLPDGYSEISEKASDKRTRVTYLNDKSESYIVFIYYRNKEEPSVFVEFSDTNAVEAQVNGCSVMFFVSEKEDVTSAITWVSTDDSLFYMSGYLGENELIMIAESVQKITKQE